MPEMTHNPYFAPLIMKRRYTKTSTFLVPFLDLPKKAFFTPQFNGAPVRFHLLCDAYLQIKHETAIDKGVIYLLLDGSEPHLLLGLLQKVRRLNYDPYLKRIGCYHVVGARIRPKFARDLDHILAGQYSSVSISGRKAILRWALLDDGPIRLGQILMRSPRLKQAWEHELKADLGRQEVWPLLDLKDETLDLDSIDTKMPAIRKESMQYELNFEGQEQIHYIQ
jgi:hypothetical protein